MKRTLFALGFLAFLTSARAEVTEANVTIQFKIHEQQSPYTNNGTTVDTYVITTLKNKDIIQAIAAAQGQAAFSPAARLISHREITPTETTDSLIIRDKNRDDYFINTNTIWLGSIQHITGSSGALVTKKKMNSTGVGSEKSFGPAELRYKAAGGAADIQLVILGQLNFSSRTIASKQFDNLTIPLNTISLSGVGSYDFGDSPSVSYRVATGSIKLSTPKVMPSIIDP